MSWCGRRWPQAKSCSRDRWTDSTLVYQGCGRGLGVETVLALDRIACRGLEPDLTLIVDIDLETSLERARARNTDYGKLGDAHGRAVGGVSPQGARRLSRARGRRNPTASALVDGGASVEAVAEEIWKIVSRYV